MTASPASADVVVIGGGIVGAACAAFLAEAGAAVVLVERDAIAAAASGRNSGVVQQPLDPVLGALYEETVRLYRAMDADDRFGLPPAPSGLLYVSRRPLAASALASKLAVSHPRLEPRFLEGSELADLEPSLHPSIAACRLEIGFPVTPGAATRAYAVRAERAGARLLLGDGGRIVVAGDRAVGVAVGDRVVAAGTIVVAAGPWTPTVVDPTGRWRPIRSLWGVVVEVSLAAAPRHVLEEVDIDDTIEPGGEEASGVAFSLVTAGGVSVLGSTFLDAAPSIAALVPSIVDRAARFVPGVSSAPLGAARACARPLSLDGRPLVGPLPWLRGAIVAAGHGPWGISTGPATGRMAAAAALGGEAAIPAALDAARFGAP